ncbi:hypothetical protein BD413DRAFT_287682 [Trametes elegans]|nr:hypothetical protein BD413DRAFT_287682 [Trametes elegans]
MIGVNVPQACLWDIFFHMYLGDASLASLVCQCSKLLATSEDLQDWDASRYGRTIRIGSEYTLLELRRLWTAYLESCSPRNGSKQSAMRDTLDQGRETVLRKYYRGGGATIYPSLRTCGPLLLNAMRLQPKYFTNFWETVTTLFNSNALVALSHPNPTFLHSMRGEGFHVHYGTDPLSPFHLAPSLQTPAEESRTAHEMVKYALAEFQDWCDAFRVRAALNDNMLAVCFLLGDALAIARTHLYQRSNMAMSIPVAQWTSHPLALSSLEYDDHHAPTTFDVIDTSNLSDHLRLLNMLIVTILILSTASPWTGVLYTETLLPHRSDPTAQFVFLLAGIDMSAFSVLMGVCSVNHISGFTTICNTYDHVMNMAQDSFGLSGLQQSHHIFARTQPGACDPEASVSGSSSFSKPPALAFDPTQLAAVLYRTY